MIHLLKLEWLKQKNYILFRILLIAYIVLLPAMLMIGKKLNFGEAGPFDPQKMLFYFPTVWEWLAWIGNWLSFFILGFLAVLMITNEHGYRTMRQNIISGLHRREWLFSKLLFATVICMFATLYYMLCSLGIGLAHVDDTFYLSTAFKNSGYAFRYFLMAFGYMSFGLLVGLLIKRTGIALFAFLGYGLFLEPVIRGLIIYKLPVVNILSVQMTPINSLEELCPVPFPSEAEQIMENNEILVFLTAEQAIILSVIWISLFNFLSLWRLSRSDL